MLIGKRAALVITGVIGVLSVFVASASASPFHHSGNLYLHQDRSAPFATLRIEVQFSRPIVMSPEDIAVAVAMTAAADHHPRLGHVDYQNRLAALQASLRLALSDEQMALVLRAPRPQFGDALTLLSEAVGAARHGAVGTELAEAQVQTLVARRRSDPWRRATFELLERALSCEEPGKEVGHSAQSGPANAHEHVIRSRPLRLALVGDFDAENLDALMTSDLYRSAAQIPEIPACRFAMASDVLRIDGQNPQSILGFVIDLGVQGSVPFELVDTARLLLESRLHQVLRQENGLTYRVRTDVLRRGGRMLLTGQLGIDPADIEAAIRLTRGDVEDLWVRGPSEIEVETAWSRIRLDGFTSLFSSDATAFRVLRLSEWNDVGSLSLHRGHETHVPSWPLIEAKAEPPPLRFLVLGQH